MAGAELGSVIPGIGTVIGGVAGGLLGGITSLFGDSAEEKRKKNLQEGLAMNRAENTYARNQGFLRLGGQVQRNMSAARQAATRRAAAMGRTNSVESFVAPVESRTQQAGGQALASYSEGLDRSLESANMGLISQFAQRDISPSVGSTIGTLGQGVASFLQNKDYINALKGYGSKGFDPSTMGIPGTGSTPIMSFS